MPYISLGMQRDLGSTSPLDEPASNEAEAPSKPGRRRALAGAPTRRRLEAADAQEAILAAAESLLVASGPEALRLIEIAAKAGVSHPNVLYHFGSVAVLQRKLAQRVAVRLADEIARVFAGDDGTRMPVSRTIDAVFSVFDEGGYARLLAWLALSQNEPTWEALGNNLEFLRSAIVAHPVLRGEANVERRRRVTSMIELVVVAAVGYGLIGRTIEGFFPVDSERPNVSRLLGELLVAAGTPRA